MKSILAAFLIITCYASCFAQSDSIVLQVDLAPGNFMPRRLLPIDQSFYLNIPQDTSKNAYTVDNVTITKQTVSGNAKEFNRCEIKRIINTYHLNINNLDTTLNRCFKRFKENKRRIKALYEQQKKIHFLERHINRFNSNEMTIKYHLDLPKMISADYGGISGAEKCKMADNANKAEIKRLESENRKLSGILSISRKLDLNVSDTVLNRYTYFLQENTRKVKREDSTIFNKQKSVKLNKDSLILSLNGNAAFYSKSKTGYQVKIFPLRFFLGVNYHISINTKINTELKNDVSFSSKVLGDLSIKESFDENPQIVKSYEKLGDGDSSRLRSYEEILYNTADTVNKESREIDSFTTAKKALEQTHENIQSIRDIKDSLDSRIKEDNKRWQRWKNACESALKAIDTDKVDLQSFREMLKDTLKLNAKNTNQYFKDGDLLRAFAAIAQTEKDTAITKLLLKQFKLNQEIRKKEKYDSTAIAKLLMLDYAPSCFTADIQALNCDTCHRLCPNCDTSKLYPSLQAHLIPINPFYLRKLFRGDISFRLKNTDEILVRDSSVSWDTKYQNFIQSVNDIALFQRLSQPEPQCREIMKRISEILFDNARLAKALSENEKLLFKKLYDNYTYTYDYSEQGLTPELEGNVNYRTQGKFSIRPDFGVGYYGNLRNAKDPASFQGFLPYFGLRFNWYPLDPKVTVNKIKYQDWFLYRSSVNVSWSFIGISDGSTRGNAFQNLNFVLGYGYRINNYLNFSTGAFFFKAKSTDPFNDSYHITALPYVSFTFDFDMVQQLKDLINIFTNLK